MVDDKLGEMIPNYCFLVTYTYALLTEGYGFQLNQPITVLDQVCIYRSVYIRVCISVVHVHICVYELYISMSVYVYAVYVYICI